MNFPHSLSVRLLLALFVYLFCSIPANAGKSQVIIENMKVEYTKMPLGIDVEKPRFSWQMKVRQAAARGYAQTAYRITVADELGRTVWDSGKTDSGISLNVEYAGLALQPATRYLWNLTVWDQKGKQASGASWFETGLMLREDIGHEWSGARWIGGGDEDKVLCSQYLPVFKLNCSIRLDKASGSTCAGFVYGANDARLMDENKNLYHLVNKKDSAYIRVELDAAPLAAGGKALLHIYRVGYRSDDRAEVPFKSFDIPRTLIDSRNMYAWHKIGISSNLGFTRCYVGDTEIGTVNLNPLGQGGDFIAFPVLGDVGFAVPAGQAAFYRDMEVRDFRSPSNVIAALDEKDGRIDGGSSGRFVTFTPDRNSSPMLRTMFNATGAGIKKARLYVTARGIYEIYLNGSRVGDDYFNPGASQYNKTLMYQTFDVTEDIRSGQNVLGAILAEGWWSGGATFTGENWNFFGDRQSLLAKLVITYTNGKEETVITEPSTWQYFNKGSLVYGSLFQGEVYDATRESALEGWSTPSYDASAWKPAVEVALDGNIHTGDNAGMPRVDDYSSFKLIGQYGQTVKAVDEITAVAVDEVRPGLFVYDMGQNMAGVPCIRLSDMEPGTRICLRYAEVKYPDLSEYKGNSGMIMLENIRAAMAQDVYITKGGEETFSPRFTSHGYRFVEISGIEKPLPLSHVKGIVLSSIHGLTSDYKTSDTLVNKLWENITWSSYANFMSIPTDCPQRNERLGWAGDISIFSRTATYLADVPQFLRRYLQAMRDVQREDGRFADIAPLGGGFGGVLWGSAGITVPWECYQQFGDKALLAEHYPAMKRYISYILDDTIDPATNLLVQYRAWGDLCDWLGPEDEKNDKSLLWEAYFIYDLELMSKMAAILGEAEDAERFERLYKERKAFFNRTYIDSVTGKTVFSAFVPEKRGMLVDTQTSYVLPLAFDIIDCESKEKVAKNLAATVVRSNTTDKGRLCPPYSLMTGFIGTAWISKALSENGYSGLAYRLLRQTDYPSWLYSVRQGATTIWERLDSYTHTDGFGGNNRMNSFNHYSFGAVGAWMYNHSLGIQPATGVPGFKRFVLKPEVDAESGMTYAEGHYDSMYGRIKSGWHIEENAVRYEFSVPCNTTALLYLPAVSPEHIREGGRKLEGGNGISILGKEDGYMVLELQSGDYSFEVL